MDDRGIEDLTEALSLERFSRYLAWAGGDRLRAVELYTLNCQLSESLYTPLHMLEVVLRNRIHRIASTAIGEKLATPWFDRPEFLRGSRQAAQIAKAKEELAEGGKALEPGRIVAALTFGYWTAFFGKDYEVAWQQILHRIARRPDGKGLGRKDFARPLTPLRILRNRIAHHEPILTWNLPSHHEKIVQLTGWLSPIAADWCRRHSRFPVLYPPQGVELVLMDLNREPTGE